MVDDDIALRRSAVDRGWESAVGRLRESVCAFDSALCGSAASADGGMGATEGTAALLRALRPASEALRSASGEVREAWDARHSEIREAASRAETAGDVDALFDVLGWVMSIEAAATEPPELVRARASLVERSLASPAFFGPQAACQVAARDLSDIRSICRIDAELVSKAIARARWPRAGGSLLDDDEEKDAEARS